MGFVGRFKSVDRMQYARDTQVVCRTARGLEVGSVLCSLKNGTIESFVHGEDSEPDSSLDGELLRPIGNEDQLILERLQRFRDRAYTACSQLLLEHGSNAVLVDVEHLFDGESLFFYFLGDVDPELEKLTEKLAETYERKVRFKAFSEKLASGCGPGCGTGESKCSSGGCSGCALSGGCGSK